VDNDAGMMVSNSWFCDRCLPVSKAAGLLLVIVLVPLAMDCEIRIVEL